MRLTGVVLIVLMMVIYTACSMPVTEPEPIKVPVDEVPLKPVVQEPIEEVNPLEVVSTFDYVSGIDYYHITGEVKNTGDKVVRSTRASVKYHTSEGKEKMFEYIVWPPRLEPGQVGAFEVSAGKAVENDVGNFEVVPGSYRYEEEDEVPYGDFEITDGPVEDKGGYFKLKAYVKNVGAGETNGVSARAIFYSGEGKVVGMGTSPVTGAEGNLKPGETTEVGFVVGHPSNTLKITSFKVVMSYS
jgi:hypothetical protein